LYRYILEARELAILSMLERIKAQIMTRIYNMQKEEMRWTGLIYPKIKKKVDINVDFASNCFVDGAGDGLFSVAEMHGATPTTYIVDLKTKTCSCQRWQKSGIPCPHVISAIRDERIDPLSLVDKCYSVEMHKRAYANIVYPCKDKTEWQNMTGPDILPPLYKKHVGRPTKNRRKAQGEVDCRGGGKRMSRRGVIMHCSHCGQPDQNRNGCYWYKNGLSPPEPSQAAPTSTTATTSQQIPPITADHPSSSQVPSYQDTLVETLAQQVIYFYHSLLTFLPKFICIITVSCIEIPEDNSEEHGDSSHSRIHFHCFSQRGPSPPSCT
jgi:hypothetical protein